MCGCSNSKDNEQESHKDIRDFNMVPQIIFTSRTHLQKKIMVLPVISISKEIDYTTIHYTTCKLERKMILGHETSHISTKYLV